jgi:hypothetical protein
MSPISEAERTAALAAIEAANRQMAERAKAPGWYHWALGGLIGGLCLAQELPMPWPAAFYPLYILGLVRLMRAYRRHTGMWIPGYRAGRTRWVAFGGAAIIGGVFLGAIWLSRSTGLHGVYAAGAVLMVLITAAVGYIWEAAYRRDLGVA